MMKALFSTPLRAQCARSPHQARTCNIPQESSNFYIKNTGLHYGWFSDSHASSVTNPDGLRPVRSCHSLLHCLSYFPLSTLNLPSVSLSPSRSVRTPSKTSARSEHRSRTWSKNGRNCRYSLRRCACMCCTCPSCSARTPSYEVAHPGTRDRWRWHPYRPPSLMQRSRLFP